MGRIDRFFAAVERLPGPPELFYAACGTGVAAVAQTIVWAAGASAGTVEPEIIETPLLAAFLIGLTHLVRRVGRSAFEDFRPALGDSPDADDFRRSLTSVPDRAAVATMLATAVVMVGSFLLFVAPYAPPHPPVVDALTALGWTTVAAAVGLFIIHDARQLRAVSRMSRSAPRIDIFDSTSTNALSRLTLVGSVALLLVVAFLVLAQPDTALTYLVETAVLASIAVATFALPLQVMHWRLEQEKRTLMTDSTTRLKLVMGRLDAAVKAGDLEAADHVDKMLNAVLAERDMLVKLRTWPWSETTFRGFASALLLPIVIFVITRVIDRLL